MLPVRNLWQALFGVYLATNVLCIIAPVECYSICRYFQYKKSILMINALVHFNFPLFIIYLSAIETLTVFVIQNLRLKGLLASVLHKIPYMIFKIWYWTHSLIVFDKCLTYYTGHNVQFDLWSLLFTILKHCRQRQTGYCNSLNHICRLIDSKLILYMKKVLFLDNLYVK